MNHLIEIYSDNFRRSFRFSEIVNCDVSPRGIDLGINGAAPFKIHDTDFQKAVVKFNGSTRELGFQEFLEYLEKNFCPPENI